MNEIYVIERYDFAREVLSFVNPNSYVYERITPDSIALHVDLLLLSRLI